jgi:hypothetical protein
MLGAVDSWTATRPPPDKGRAAGVTGYSRVTSRGGLSSRKAMNLV